MGGDGSTATAGGAIELGGDEVVISPGNDNTAAVVGDGSTATAGPVDDNTAIVTGDNLTATATGNGTTVEVP